MGGIALETHSSINIFSSSNIVYAAKKEKKSKKTIKLKKYGDFQFSGAANIQPTKAVIKKKNMTFHFDWRNDNGLFDESSFNGSSVTISAFQNGQKLKDDYDKMLNDTSSDLYFKTEKNTTIELSFKYKLLDKTPVTIKMEALESDPQEFTFDLK